MLRYLAALVMLFRLAAPSFAVDLSSIERKIGREPNYKSKPKYALVVFGQEAKTRVWLVLDGDTLYVDLDGSGDITLAKKVLAASVDAHEKPPEEDSRHFYIRALQLGTQQLRNFVVQSVRIDGLSESDDTVKKFLAKTQNGNAIVLSADIAMPEWQDIRVGGWVHQATSYKDINGILQFADKPQEAPIIHFGGPWQVMLTREHTLEKGEESKIVAGVGTPGVGAGTTVWIDHEGIIPQDAFPTVKIKYPDNQIGTQGLEGRFELKERC